MPKQARLNEQQVEWLTLATRVEMITDALVASHKQLVDANQIGPYGSPGGEIDLALHDLNQVIGTLRHAAVEAEARSSMYGPYSDAMLAAAEMEVAR